MKVTKLHQRKFWEMPPLFLCQQGGRDAIEGMPPLHFPFPNSFLPRAHSTVQIGPCTYVCALLFSRSTLYFAHHMCLYLKHVLSERQGLRIVI